MYVVLLLLIEKTAANLDPANGDSLSPLLLQVSGPAHIPWNDPRWQELLLAYDVWVHLEHTRQEQDLVSMACRNMKRHAAQSSNLASLSLHVARMTRELNHSDLTNHIAVVGKARATAGAIHLLRILIHDVDPIDLEEALVYTSRDMADKGIVKQVGSDLIGALLNFLAAMGPRTDPLERIPEIYDATVNCLELVLVLLSTQLYQPVLSSTQRKGRVAPDNRNYVLDYIMEQAHQRRHTHEGGWTPQSILHTCLMWQTLRPKAPERSIAHHMTHLAESVVDAKGSKKGPDGMYETHVLVLAETPRHQEQRPVLRRGRSGIFLDATRGVLVLSSSIFLLPFRLMNLALGLLGRRTRGPSYDTSRKEHYLTRQLGRTNDVLWLTKSPVADLASMLLLILINNYRVATGANMANAFRAEMAALNDNRWDEPDPFAHDNNNIDAETKSLMENDHDMTAQPATPLSPSRQLLTTNFEALFESFGSTVHTEVGALLLYSMFQSSPIFAASMAVRSDLDKLVMPLLRTLYYSSSLKHYSASTSQDGMSIRNCPFRSSSQLYVILILLLLFSQDASFGPDAFRRVTVPSVPWYKERNLNNISLGSLVLLTLLRSITFNLNRLHDVFLLSNCCAVLMNLSPNVVHLPDYAAMRLASVTASCLKKYAAMVTKNGDKLESDDEFASPLGMYGEVSRTLLRLIQHCTSPKNIDKNCHLVYALVYHQHDFKMLFSKKDSPFHKKEIGRMEMVIQMADKLIQDNGEARTAPKALKVLRESMSALKEAAKDVREKEESDFTFSYEEEADPEIFFVPYIWEVVVCVVTSSTIDWDTSRIKVFPLLEEEGGAEEDEGAPVSAIEFSENVDDVV